MNSVQKLETVGISYSSADIFRLIESGWHVSYSNQTMSAWRTVQKHEDEDPESDLNLDQLQKEEKE
ncbi:hypothetical protein [Candidatus Electronema sp. JC]|uniref:hypothetical protein n=1 Tax=Candidatus Electronema sp. JC TaxID=3401570 RepID=UPI003B43D50A